MTACLWKPVMSGWPGAVSLRISPGATALTVMPAGPSSRASARVMRDDGAFRGHVVQQERRALGDDGRGDVHDPPAACTRMTGDSRPRPIPHALHVDRHRRGPTPASGIASNGWGLSVAKHGRVVDQDVDRGRSGRRRRPPSRGRGSVAHVGGHTQRLRPRRASPRRRPDQRCRPARRPSPGSGARRRSRCRRRRR